MGPLQFLFFGAIGGLARGLLGAYKQSLNIGAGKKIEWGKMLLQVGCSCVVGGVVGMIVDDSVILAATSGYVGIDIADSVLKLSKKS